MQFIDLDGHRLCVPEGHPSFSQLNSELADISLYNEQYTWSMEALTQENDLGLPVDIQQIKRQCASEAFAWWMLSAKKLRDKPGPWFNHTRDDGLYSPCPKCLERTEDIHKAQWEEGYAMAWAAWGGLLSPTGESAQTSEKEVNP